MARLLTMHIQIDLFGYVGATWVFIILFLISFFFSQQFIMKIQTKNGKNCAVNTYIYH